jgi:KDO2-lipid IV(A) lauroyltransferase
VSVEDDQSLPSPAPRSTTSPLILIRQRYEYGLLRVGVAVARALPLEIGARVNGWMWSAVARHLSRHRRADRHLNAMWPELSPAERRRILLSMWRHLGATFIEGLQIDRIACEPDRIELDAACRAILRRTVEEGGIIACVHLGNWEAATAPLAAAGARHLGVYRSVGNPLIDAYIRRLRAPYFSSGLVAKGHAAARGLLRQARQGGSIGMMADLRDLGGVAVPFFSRPAPSTPAPATLARQFGRPLFAVALVRVAASRFKMQAVEIEVRRSADRAGDVRDATAAIQATFEGWIRRWPDQWMWAHRRYDAKPRQSRT